MKKEWNVKIDDQMYTVSLKGRKVTVNNEVLKLYKYKKKSGLVHEEYEIPIGAKTGLIVIKNMSAPQLVIDGRDCATGEEYEPIKIPKWAYIFVVLHFVNFLNGALGVVLAIIGLSLTVSVSCNKKMNVGIRILLDIGILVASIALVFGIAYLVAGIYKGVITYEFI